MSAGNDLLNMTAATLRAAFESRALSPVEVVTAVLNAAQDSQADLNAFAVLDFDGALAAARRSENRWLACAPLSPVDGVPVSIKDNLYVAGMPTRFGSRAIPDELTLGPDSPAPARLREAGAVLFGKTTTPDYAHKLVTDSPLTGVTRNPWDRARSPGGSSGGAVAALAAGIGPVAIGSDGGGSIRVPAAWTGVFGLKPTFGRVPHYPRGAFAPLSHVGPLTRSVADAAEVMAVICAPDDRDWYSLAQVAPPFRSICAPLKDVRVAFSPSLSFERSAVDAEISRAVTAAAHTFESLGALVESANPPPLQRAVEATGVLWIAFSALLTEQLGERSALLDTTLLDLAARGRTLPGNTVTSAIVQRGEIGAAIDCFFRRFDLLIAPVTPTHAPRLDDAQTLAMLRPTLTSWCNFTGNPAASIPCGTTAGGLPIGLHIIAPRGRDAFLLQACRAFEQTRVVQNQDGFELAPRSLPP
jgi:aspartyl-tRNA(Asn)/glutamyl-tRNA(Gln) amidotransferase subunit A